MRHHHFDLVLAGNSPETSLPVVEAYLIPLVVKLPHPRRICQIILAIMGENNLLPKLGGFRIRIRVIQCLAGAPPHPHERQQR
jgi:hypothetical protein